MKERVPIYVGIGITVLASLVTLFSLGVGHNGSGVGIILFAPALLLVTIIGKAWEILGFDQTIGKLVLGCFFVAQYPFYGYVLGKVFGNRISIIWLFAIAAIHVVSIPILFYVYR